MSYGADVVVKFQDGTLPANSVVLGMCSSVLRGAVEVGGLKQADVISRDTSSSNNRVIPMPGIKKGDWMQTASFLYPVVPPPVISSWDQLDVLLRVAKQFDIQRVLHIAEQYLIAHVNELYADPLGPQNIWQWLRAADKAGLQECLPALVARAVHVDRAGCACKDNLQGLSPPALQQLVVECAAGYPSGPCPAGAKPTTCTSPGCRNGWGGIRTFNAGWVCSTCRMGIV